MISMVYRKNRPGKTEIVGRRRSQKDHKGHKDDHSCRRRNLYYRSEYR